MTLFHDRQDAGRRLAAELQTIEPASLVLGLPRGGVPVAYEVAQKLGIALDVFPVRKLGVPGHQELAMGAIASGGGYVVNTELVAPLGLSNDDIDAARAREREELLRRQRRYRGTETPADVAGKKVILVDDGLATGASMGAALKGVRALGAARVTVAAPVGSADILAFFKREADTAICLETPEPFYSVGRWYTSFPQTSDDEVCELLRQGSSS